MWNNDEDKKASYFAWANNEPSNTNGKCNIENCVEMKYPSLKWNDMVCNGYNSYVCQLSRDNNNGKRYKGKNQVIMDCVVHRPEYICM